MSYPSVTAAFSFDIPFSDFLKNNGIEPPQGSSSDDERYKDIILVGQQ